MLVCPVNANTINNDTVSERRLSINQNDHTGPLYEWKSPAGIHFSYYQLASAEKGNVTIDHHDTFLHIGLTIRGLKNYSSAQRHLLTLESNECNFLLTGKQPLQLSWEPEEKLETFEIGISIALLSNILPAESPLWRKLTDNNNTDTSKVLSKYNLPVSAAVKGILFDMLHCKLSGAYKTLYYKGKLMELLALQLEQYEQYTHSNHTIPCLHHLRKEDVEKMYLVEAIILKKLYSPCSLIDLAHQVGTNETYLKQHFKKVFGTTVFGYMQHVKMKKAQEMLLDGKSVLEVANKMGYKHAAHFTRAFKKHVGYQPGKLKQ